MENNIPESTPMEEAIGRVVMAAVRLQISSVLWNQIQSLENIKVIAAKDLALASKTLPMAQVLLLKKQYELVAQDLESDLLADLKQYGAYAQEMGIAAN